MDIQDGENNVMGVSDATQKFFDTGLLGALITTIVASIAWQLVASAFPMAFLSTPITYILLRICLFLEATGICNGAWVIAKVHKQFAGYKPDEVYIGTAEERASKNHADNDAIMHVEAGHMYPGVPVLPNNMERHLTLEEIDEAQKKIAEHIAELENRQKKLTEAKNKLTRGWEFFGLVDNVHSHSTMTTYQGVYRWRHVNIQVLRSPEYLVPVVIIKQRMQPNTGAILVFRRVFGACKAHLRVPGTIPYIFTSR